ncbi:MAG: ATP synthase subunit alpha [candidate division TM6 bacterium GW2011_GWF2_38_10]|nr:MAG: ATP synthase subunit alpha [candidate division TM6 bacterium GW2011_GWF2_38_10]
MIERDTDLVSILEQSLSQVPHDKLEEIGTVIKTGDGICKIYGLTNAAFGEVITFEKGAKGMVLDIDEDFVSVALFEGASSVTEQDIARRSGSVFSVPADDKMLGRVVNAMGKPIDALGPIETDHFMPIEHPVAGIIDRSPINESLETGFTVIDSLIPIGKGQRELLIGNRSTGKTTIVLDTILHQKNKDVICIYVSIGHKQANTARIIHLLEQYGAMDYTIVVDADAKETSLNQFIAPYAGCAIGEYFMGKGRSVLIIYDDLSKHAIAYRELSLLLRRPPGREAYPGDIFYIHSRLLERSGKLSKAHGGGSLTAIPIVQTQGDDISAYIPTNLISITDGQIFLDTNLFNSGIRPAVNVGLSVSRVGGAAQTKAIRSVSSSLKLELAQYNELLAFAQFGSELDKASQRALDRGRRAVEILKQAENETYSFIDQTLFLFLLKENFLDKLAYDVIKDYVVTFASYVRGTHQEAYQAIAEKAVLDAACGDILKKAAEEFALVYTAA